MWGISMNRNYYLDNYKAVLIILVVTTHFLGGLAGNSGIIKTYTIFTNLFYMPAFIMISGYFSKRTELIKLVKTILIPYFVFQILNLVVDYFVLHKDMNFSLLVPEFTLWYLLSLFFWRLIVEHFACMKYPVLIAIVLSLIIGLDSNVGGFLSLSRTFYFFPFFMMGYLCDLKKILKYRTVIIRIITAGIIFLMILVIFFTCKGYSEFYFRGSTSYEGLGQPMLLGMLFRLFCYMVAVLLSFCVAMWIPRKKNILSFLGSRTMGIYMWHGVIYRILKYGTPLYKFLAEADVIGRIICLLIALFLVFLLSSKPVAFVTRKISEIPIERIVES